MTRSVCLQQLAAAIASVRVDHPTRVAIDGVDGVGKTTLAQELVEPVAATGRQVVRASVDGFHHPRRARYRRGPVDAPLLEAVHRAAVADETAIRASYSQRYVPGQRMYLSQCEPKASADVIVDNTDLHNPGLHFRQSGASVT